MESTHAAELRRLREEYEERVAIANGERDLARNEASRLTIQINDLYEEVDRQEQLLSEVAARAHNLAEQGRNINKGALSPRSQQEEEDLQYYYAEAPKRLPKGLAQIGLCEKRVGALERHKASAEAEASRLIRERDKAIADMKAMMIRENDSREEGVNDMGGLPEQLRKAQQKLLDVQNERDRIRATLDTIRNATGIPPSDKNVMGNQAEASEIKSEPTGVDPLKKQQEQEEPVEEAADPAESPVGSSGGSSSASFHSAHSKTPFEAHHDNKDGDIQLEITTLALNTALAERNEARAARDRAQTDREKIEQELNDCQEALLLERRRGRASAPSPSSSSEVALEGLPERETSRSFGESVGQQARRNEGDPTASKKQQQRDVKIVLKANMRKRKASESTSAPREIRTSPRLARNSKPVYHGESLGQASTESLRPRKRNKMA